MKTLLFSITMKDLEMQTFSVGGHGGGGKDTSNSGVRLTHRESGASAEGRDHRSNTRNREDALRKLVETKRFKAWHKIKCAEMISGKTIKEIVEEQMVPENIKVEYVNGI